MKQEFQGFRYIHYLMGNNLGAPDRWTVFGVIGRDAVLSRSSVSERWVCFPICCRGSSHKVICRAALMLMEIGFSSLNRHMTVRSALT
jgi:hypothetical protein